MSLKSNGCEQLILLTRLGNWYSTCIEVCLQAGLFHVSENQKRLKKVLTSDHVPMALLKRSSAINCASSVALAYWLPAAEVAAPKADSPEALITLAAEYPEPLAWLAAEAPELLAWLAAECPEPLAWLAALFAEFTTLSPVREARCLRAIARSSLRLDPCGTLIPFLSAHSLISIHH